MIPNKAGKIEALPHRGFCAVGTSVAVGCASGVDSDWEEFAGAGVEGSAVSVANPPQGVGGAGVAVKPDRMKFAPSTCTACGI